ncbi:hypothetical protein P7C73_g4727, partial [Tremellales sp. Uapishka_1]
MTTSNPSHLLISRNPPRSPAHPQLVPTYTTRHLHQPAFVSDQESDSELTPSGRVEDDSGEEGYAEDEEIVIDPTFWKDAVLPGRVKVIVGKYTFWCHKEVLWFASPFFQAILQGSWAETSIANATPSVKETSRSRQASPTNTDTVIVSEKAYPPEEAEAGVIAEESEGEDESRKASVYMDASEDGPSIAQILQELRELPSPDRQASPLQEDVALGEVEPQPPSSTLRHSSPPRPTLLQPPTSLPLPPTVTTKSSLRSLSRRRRSRRPSSSLGVARKDRGRGSVGRGKVDAVVELREESAGAFQDFLFWAYPHLDCRITWTNVENLLALSSKLIVPALQKLCEHFLLTHASGRPIMALSLAEQHLNPELFREASRFVLDLAVWDKSEMEVLSEQTQLKLSMRRTWFLERLLKLGSVDVKKDYTCVRHHSTRVPRMRLIDLQRHDCPDQTKCQAQLDEKWRQAHSAVCRYGPPQPSVAFRCLRQLETFPTNPSLVMPHPLCQSAAKSWVMTLFDRMFQPKLGYGPVNPGTEKYWLWISMS